MRREIPVSSNDKNPELLRVVQEEVMPQEREKREFMYEGEIEKTEAHVRWINTALDLIQQKLMELGLRDELSDELPISIDRIHILNGESYDAVTDDSSDHEREMGMYHPVIDQVFVRDMENQLELFLTTLHELIHYFSHRTDFLKVFSDGDVNLRERRVGYRNLNYGSDPHEHFRGLNEMVVEWVGFQIASDNEALIKSSLSGDPVDPENLVGSEIWDPALIWNDGAIFIDILEGIAKYRGEELKDTSNRIERGLFTGEMMHLRDIEKAYGENALRILSYYRTTIKVRDGMTVAEVNSMIREYFDSGMDKQERALLGKKILESIEEV